MHKVKEVIVVEGRYDKNTLSQVVDAVIIETSGFGIFNNTQKQKLLRTMAEKRGLIVMTDSDGAGFVIRNFIRSCVDPKLVKHAYIPDLYGKERRKAHASKEGKLGVEGMTPEIILSALRASGATLEEEASETPSTAAITKQHMMELGLSGTADSSRKRARLQKRLGLPEHMSANALLQALNLLYTTDELSDLVKALEKENG